MKSFYIFLISVIITTFMNSCDKNRNLDGDWDDNIKLSQKNIVFNSNQNTVTITTQSTSWWLNGVSLNNSMTDLNGVDILAKNFTITSDDFQIERKEDGKKIVITINQNLTNSDRTLIMSMQSGDYFDGIRVLQSK